MIDSILKLITGLRLGLQKYSLYAHAARIFVLVSIGFMLYVGTGTPLTALAATNTVTNFNDSGPGSLRQVINDAAPGDTITFAVSGTITLTSGQLVINKDLSLIGSGAANISISGNTNIPLSSRVINNSAHLTISGLTILHGDAGVGDGGGILNAGTGVLTIINSVITANNAQKGGGIYNSAGGHLQVTNSTISADSSRPFDANLDASGGGIYNVGIATINNSTFRENSVHDNGSALYNDATATVANSTFTLGQAKTAAVYNEKNGTLELNNVTITNNTGAQKATGLLSNGGTVNLANTIISGNKTSGNNNQPDCSGKITSGGHNLIGNATGCTISAGTGDQLGSNVSPIDAKLGPLFNNGGPTLTFSLLAGSPAIDTGSPALPGSGSGACEAVDQRGVVRPIQGATSLTCDIGAVEMGGNPPPTNTPTATATSVPPTATNTATSTATSIPATATNTATSTATSIPPSATNTATSTATSALPSATNTATSTATSVPPSSTNTATSTATSIPPSSTNTATSTATSIPPSATNAVTATPTNTPTPPPLLNTPGNVKGDGVIKSSLNRFTFEFEVMISKGELVPSGTLTFKDRGANISFKATSFTLLNIHGKHALISGYATVNGKTNVVFIVDAYDLGRRGTSDKFMIQIQSLNGYSTGGFLTGGNIQIKKPHERDVIATDRHDPTQRED